MVLEISIILTYLAYIFITDFKMGLPMVVVIGQFIDIPMLIQTLILGIVFFGMKEIREIYHNERLTGRILFLIALVSVLNAMIYTDGKTDMSTYIVFYSLPVFYCSIISLAVNFIEKGLKGRQITN